MREKVDKPFDSLAFKALFAVRGVCLLAVLASLFASAEPVVVITLVGVVACVECLGNWVIHRRPSVFSLSVICLALLYPLL